MGLFSALSGIFGIGKRQVNIIVVGLDNSGKSTFLNQLKPPEQRTSQIVPTVGNANSSFSTGNLTFNAYDMAGQSKYRSLWESYYVVSQALIFVVDSADKMRIPLARDEFWIIMDHKDVASRPIPILVLANKMDETDAMSASEISTSLGLDVIRGRNWTIQATCATTGAGVDKALEWLSVEMQKYLASRQQ